MIQNTNKGDWDPGAPSPNDGLWATVCTSVHHQGKMALEVKVTIFKTSDHFFFKRKQFDS